MSAPEAVLAGLYQAHAHELHGFARRRVGRQEAEDVVQDAYLHLLQKDGFETLEHPRAFLFRIASNLAVDAARKTKTRTRYAEDEIEFLGLGSSAAGPETTVDGAIVAHRFHACLKELPAPCREAFLLSLTDDLTHAEIARRLGVSVRTIDRHMVRALNHVRRRFQGPQKGRAA
ncbi:RNA polymerase sigma factor [Methylocapsa aurea]|uniref:RNA polymerase sigma factor n=1 Tax=Methylocapsa aurea TaxID=663610 RepID=UPI00068D0E6F|nr:RNA polymerase sigma factor [Methylocapsa aurea]